MKRTILTAITIAATGCMPVQSLDLVGDEIELATGDLATDDGHGEAGQDAENEAWGDSSGSEGLSVDTDSAEDGAHEGNGGNHATGTDDASSDSHGDHGESDGNVSDAAGSGDDSESGDGEESGDGGTDDSDHDETCAPAEYQQALDCVDSIQVHQECRARAGVTFEGDHVGYGCDVHFNCDPHWNARRHWEYAECMKPCRDSHPEDYLRYLCAIEEHSYFRACLIWTDFECTDPAADLTSEHVGNCHTVAAFHRDQCLLAGHLSEVPEWALHPPERACDAAEFAEADECREHWQATGASQADLCEDTERPAIVRDWQVATGSDEDPPAEFVSCELTKRCDGHYEQMFADEVAACIAPCSGSHPGDMLDAECNVDALGVARECLAAVDCFAADGVAQAQQCLAEGEAEFGACVDEGGE